MVGKGHTVLHKAVLNGNVEFVEELAEAMRQLGYKGRNSIGRKSAMFHSRDIRTRRFH